MPLEQQVTKATIAVSEERVSQEIRNRTKLSVYAYSYEFLAVSLVDDHAFDALAYSIDTKIKTGNEKMDKFFEEKFDPSTGMWIHHHPELDKIINIYKNYYEKDD